MVVANLVGQPGAGFESETNAVTLVLRTGETVEVPQAGKREIADRILDRVKSLRGTRG
jgi:phosphopantothenoylcysteine decarboxylase/phosphopantothenate--cysteine ligase